MAKKPVTKLNAMHHIGYGAGDAGGVLMLMMISYLEYFSRNILGVSSYVYAAILVVWNVWDAINDPRHHRHGLLAGIPLHLGHHSREAC